MGGGEATKYYDIHYKQSPLQPYGRYLKSHLQGFLKVSDELPTFPEDDRIERE